MALSSDQGGPRPEEGVVDRVAGLRVVADGDLGKQRWLLRWMVLLRLGLLSIPRGSRG
jgi:hypothetical protein